MNLFNDDLTGFQNKDEERRLLKERLEKRSKFSPSEIELIQIDSGAPLEDLLQVLNIIYQTNLDFKEKVSLLKSIKYGVEVLISLATMDRE